MFIIYQDGLFEEISTVQGGGIVNFPCWGDMSFLKQPIDSNVQLTVNLNH